jgi:hypothetical protein
MSNSQRQAKYRRTRFNGPHGGDRRLNCWISSDAAVALDLLARHRGITKRALIERLALDAQRDVLDTIKIDSPQWERYFHVTP